MKIALRISLLVILGTAVAVATTVPRPVRIGHSIGERDFTPAPSQPHAPVAEVGGEARAVVAAPRMHLIVELYGLQDPGGVLRHELRLPEALARRRDVTFRLAGQRLPQLDGIPPEGLVALGNAPLKQLARGWSLEHDATDPARATLVLRSNELSPVEPLGAVAPGSGLITLRLVALEPTPAVLETREFVVPPRPVLELGWGIMTGHAPPGAEVTFRARLDCAERADVELMVDRIAAGSEAARRWHEAVIPLPDEPLRCRLRLTTANESGPPALWSMPRLTTPAGGEVQEPGPNLILVSLDTLRPDHLSGHGYPRATSPEIDRRLIARGTTFSDAITPFPQTAIAHMGLFTGLYPGAQPLPGRLPPNAPVRTLAESLRDAGFETAAFTEDALVAGSMGFWHGFDRFSERTLGADELLERGLHTFDDGIRYLRTRGEQHRFFLFLHTYKVHAPYASSAANARLFSDPSDWVSGRLDRAVPEKERANVDTYDRAIRDSDDLMAALLNELDRLGIAERTIVALVSDHGESFGEHGIPGHGFGVGQEELRAALILRGPGIPEGLRVTSPVSLVDVSPTLLELLRVAPLAGAQGVSLVPLLKGASVPDRPLFFSWLAPDSKGVRLRDWKLARANGRFTLWNLRRDPAERRPIVVTKEKIPPGLRYALAVHEADNKRRQELLAKTSREQATRPEISDAVEQSLRALGYL